MHECSTLSLEYTSIVVDDDTMLYLEKRDANISSFFSNPDLRNPMLNLQSFKFAHISQNAGEPLVFGLPHPKGWVNYKYALISKAARFIAWRISWPAPALLKKPTGFSPMSQDGHITHILLRSMYFA